MMTRHFLLLLRQGSAAAARSCAAPVRMRIMLAQAGIIRRGIADIAARLF